MNQKEILRETIVNEIIPHLESELKTQYINNSDSLEDIENLIRDYIDLSTYIEYIDEEECTELMNQINEFF